MIIKMKSVTVLGLESHTDEILEELRRIGVVHIKHVKPPEGLPLEVVADEVAKANAVCEALPEGPKSVQAPLEGKELVDKVFALVERKRALSDEIAQLEREASRVEFLGDFEPADIEHLEARGIHIRLYRCGKKELSALPSELVYRTLSEKDKKAVIAAVFCGTEEELPLVEVVPLPSRSAAQARRIAEERKQELAQVQRDIIQFAAYRADAQRTLVDLQDKWELEKVRFGKGEAENVMYLKGFCPVTEIGRLEYAARKNAWGLVLSDPQDDEEPPTLITNPKWVRVIEPVFGITKTIPGYREFDISAIFLFFFSIFFAMLIGDAGYGLVYMTITAVAQAKLGKKLPTKRPFQLMYVLTSATIVWGAVTGNWFGVEALARIAPFKYFIIPSLDAYTDQAQQVVMHMCLIIAVVQMSLGHLLVAIRYINSRRAIEQFGWIAVLWSTFFATRWLVLGYDLPGFVLYLLAGGIAAILLVVLPAARGGLDVFLGIWGTGMSAIGAFADTMSYIRLFAVGLATLAVAQSFNDMAVRVGFDSVVRGLGASLIIVAGHTLNLAMGLLAVIVHGVRLNLLEFSTHVGNAWSGYEYNPFEKKLAE